MGAVWLRTGSMPSCLSNTYERCLSEHNTQQMLTLSSSLPTTLTNVFCWVHYPLLWPLCHSQCKIQVWSQGPVTPGCCPLPARSLCLRFPEPLRPDPGAIPKHSRASYLKGAPEVLISLEHLHVNCDDQGRALPTPFVIFNDSLSHGIEPPGGKVLPLHSWHL